MIILILPTFQIRKGSNEESEESDKDDLIKDIQKTTIIRWNKQGKSWVTI